MSTKSRQTILQGDRAEAEAGRSEGYRGPAQPSPTIRQCLNGALAGLRSNATAVRPAPACRSPTSAPREVPIWKLEAALKCRSCRKGRYAPSVHMIKLTETREILPYRWVHPDEERRAV